jgi:hypothetical protein
LLIFYGFQSANPAPQYERLVDLLRDLSLLCREGTADVRVQMQRLLRNLDVHAEVLALLRLNLNAKDAGCALVVETAHNVLRDFMHTNSANQAVLFKDLGYFVAQAAKSELAAQTATAIFAGNPDLCARVPKSSMDAVISAIDTKGRRLSYIRFFRALLQGSGQLAKPVQNLVADCLQSASEKVLLLYTDETLFRHQFLPLLRDSSAIQSAFEVRCFGYSLRVFYPPILTLLFLGRGK